ncbi:MAG: hypothetical protein SGILL_005572 [Bacillariaceae sp.]
MTMLPLNQNMNAPLAEGSPSASSFKKPLSASEHAKATQPQHSKKRRGSMDVLRRSSHHKSKAQQQQQPADAPAPPAKKKVTFARTAKVKKVRSRQHYSEEETLGMWYTVDEYTMIKRRCVQTLRLMMTTPSFQDTPDHTSRGLESRTKDAARKRKEFKAYSRELVLEEQENQREAGAISSGRIRKAYLEASETATRHALAFAHRDTQERIAEPLDYLLKIVRFENGMR